MGHGSGVDLQPTARRLNLPHRSGWHHLRIPRSSHFLSSDSASIEVVGLAKAEQGPLLCNLNIVAHSDEDDG